jgi:hypothetical protein
MVRGGTAKRSMLLPCYTKAASAMFPSFNLLKGNGIEGSSGSFSSFLSVSQPKSGVGGFAFELLLAASVSK